MSQDNATRLKQAKKSLRIQDVMLYDNSIIRDDKLDNLQESYNEEEISVVFNAQTVGHKTVVHKSRQENTPDVYFTGFDYITFVGLHHQVSNQQPTNETEILTIRTTFRAVYTTDEMLDNETLQYFGEKNVGYHVHPYWREYIASISTRMRLPTITLPMYVI